MIINFGAFPAFRVVFEPELIKWDHDPEPFVQWAKEVAKGEQIPGRSSAAAGALPFAIDKADVYLESPRHDGK